MKRNKKWLGLIMIFILVFTGFIISEAVVKTLPVRATFEGIGYKVGWIQEEKAITLEKDLLFVKLYKDSPIAWINGNYEKLMTPVRVQNGVSYTDESLIALLYDQSYTYSQGKIVLKPEAKPSMKYALPVVGTKEKLLELLPEFNGYMYLRGSEEPMFLDGIAETTTAPALSEQKSEEEFSNTNVQVKGIDEGDVVKTDGRYIYTIKEGKIIIVDTDNDALKQVSTIGEKDMYIQEMYVSGSQLIAIGTKSNYSVQSENIEQKKIYMPYYEQLTAVSIYDLSDIAKPLELKTFGLKGYSLSSRLKDKDFYMVINQNNWYGEQPYPTLRIDDGEEIQYGPERIHYFPDTSPTGMMMTFALSLDQLDTDPDVAVYLTSGDTLYMSAENLYVAQSVYPYYRVKTEEQREKTAISKFTLDHGRMVFTMTKEIDGQLINQWSMDEYKDNLRVAVNTSVGYIGDESTVSRIAVYSKNLELLGKTEDLAKGEKIYASRFMGDIAYLVTFKQIDPFFAIDCSVPEKPVVLGYLKIPGYSQYLHPLSDTKILGLGHQTKETQTGVINDGLKFSIFDTANMKDINEIDNMVVGSGSASSDSLYDHKAFMIHLGKQLFALPVNIYQDYNNKTEPFDGAYIIQYTDDYQMKVLGTIQHQSTQYQGTERIKRILYIGETLYTVSENQIDAFQINDLKPIAKVEFK